MEPKSRNSAVLFFWGLAVLFLGACGYTIYEQYKMLENPPTQFEVKDEPFTIPDFTICPSGFSTLHYIASTCEIVGRDGEKSDCGTQGKFEKASPITYRSNPQMCTGECPLCRFSKAVIFMLMLLRLA